jgi:protein-L-isoaspartate(D-aspartate) O-methyltransferase
LRTLTSEELIQQLIKGGWLKTPRIIKAFKVVGRVDFMPEEHKSEAFANIVMPIGYGQTISQPAVVALMLELLQPESGEKILDVGSGSGWTSVLLSKLVGRKGKVVAIEIIPELKKFGENNAQKHDPEKIIEFICADGSKGWEDNAPYDKILVSAEALDLPQALREQLKIGGRIVIPIGSSICLFVKKSETELEGARQEGFSFVPLVNEKNRFDREVAREFLSKNILHKDVFRVLMSLTLSGDSSSADKITNLINSQLASKGSKKQYSIESVNKALLKLSEFGLIKAFWLPTLPFSGEDIKDLLGMK